MNKEELIIEMEKEVATWGMAMNNEKFKERTRKLAEGHYKQLLTDIERIKLLK